MPDKSPGQGYFQLKISSTLVYYRFSEEDWVVPEKIHTPLTEEISAVRRGRGEKIVSDNTLVEILGRILTGS